MNQKEKEYIKAVIAPFRDKVKYICKTKTDYGHCIDIYYYNDFTKDEENVYLPYFKPGTEYRGMKLNRDYTLDELGI